MPAQNEKACGYQHREFSWDTIIIYGILGLAVFVRFLGLGRRILAGGLTLAVLVCQLSSCRRVNPFDRSLWLCALPRWDWERLVGRTAMYHVLPAASGDSHGKRSSPCRVRLENLRRFLFWEHLLLWLLPHLSFFDGFTALPIQIYTWASRPLKIFPHSCDREYSFSVCYHDVESYRDSLGGLFSHRALR